MTFTLRGSDVYVGDNSLLLDALHRGGAVVVRLYYEVAHYVLFTGVKDGQILLSSHQVSWTQNHDRSLWNQHLFYERITEGSF